MSTIEENSKTVARNFYEGYSNGDLQTLFDKYISNSLINHAMGGSLTRQSWLDYDKAIIAAAPNLKATVFEQVAEENKVVTRWAFEGTHTQNLFDKPATGNSVRLEAITIDIVKDGKIVEHNIAADVTQFLQQFEKK
ncbi:MAG TPA: ester cyclase [Bacteroidia bacterium]|nr:ester cyclase [Bacteroidia bacterium]